MSAYVPLAAKCARCGHGAKCNRGGEHGTNGDGGYGEREGVRPIGDGSPAHRERVEVGSLLGEGVWRRELTTASGGSRKRNGDRVLGEGRSGSIPSAWG